MNSRHLAMRYIKCLTWFSVSPVASASSLTVHQRFGSLLMIAIMASCADPIRNHASCACEIHPVPMNTLGQHGTEYRSAPLGIDHHLAIDKRLHDGLGIIPSDSKALAYRRYAYGARCTVGRFRYPRFDDVHRVHDGCGFQFAHAHHRVHPRAL